MHSDRLARRFPNIEVDPDVLFVQDGNVVTSAGTAAGIDAALHIVRVEHGAAATNVIARRMVVPPQRDGGQSQYIQAPVPERRADSFAEVTEWMLQHLDQDLTVDQLARLAGFGTAAVMRHHFLKVLQTTPTAYRRTFSCRDDEAMAG
jgi:transcriptional regulator GlxA family with amidase domain